MSTDYGYEVDHDDYDRLVGPSQEEPEEEPPVNLDEIEESFSIEHGKIREISPNSAYIADALPYLIEELRQARADAERRAASARREYAVTDGPPPAHNFELVTAEQAGLILANNKAKSVWERAVHAAQWHQLSSEPPF